MGNGKGNQETGYRRGPLPLATSSINFELSTNVDDPHVGPDWYHAAPISVSRLVGWDLKVTASDRGKRSNAVADWSAAGPTPGTGVCTPDDSKSRNGNSSTPQLYIH
eukprot:GHVT01022045.1.p2 GENE.GHVT01022045.1~~GHVT01022045.1.p2  ORF type:complete len:107 (+),score=16.36 GHVT01022045.1:564-884(+)